MNLTGLLREASRAISAGGLLWVGMPTDPRARRPLATDDGPRSWVLTSAEDAHPGCRSGPPAEHPQRTCSPWPSNQVELLLQRQLVDHRAGRT